MRTLKNNLIILFLLFLGETVLGLPLCELGVETTEQCLTPNPGMYVYAEPYGGRGIEGASQVFTQNQLTHAIPMGWYESSTMSLSPLLINSSSFSNSLNIFGTAGVDLSSGAAAVCSYGSALTAECTVPMDKYVYKAPNIYGERTAVCAAVPATGVGVNASQCWFIPAGAGAYIARGTTLPLCASQTAPDGKISGPCIAPEEVGNNSYYYSVPYGGHDANCLSSVSGEVNTQSCWVPPAQTLYKITAACAVGGTRNAIACDVGSGTYAYKTSFGGRGELCDDIARTSDCWYAPTSKADATNIGKDLIAANIKNGVSIFGVTGTDPGTPINWQNGAHKTQGALRRSYKDEANCGLLQKINGSGACVSAGADLHHPVPDPQLDHDGSSGAFGVDRTGWGTTTCGTTGTLTTRISNCLGIFPVSTTGGSAYRNGATWNGNGSLGNAGFGVWKLVTRSCQKNSCPSASDLVEVWKDSNTGLYWSSRVSAAVNWCRASGSHNNSAQNETQELDPSGFCSSATHQNQTGSIISACYDTLSGSGFSNVDADIPTNTSKNRSQGKAGLYLENSVGQKVYWRLPTLYDYRVANYNGLRFVLPDMTASSSEEWTSTVVSTDRSKAWTFQSATGQKLNKIRNQKVAARCVGRGQ